MSFQTLGTLPKARMIQRELTDKDMAIRLIQGMSNRTTFEGIISRLQTIAAAVELSGMMVADGVMDEKAAIDWLVSLIKSYEPPTPREHPSPSQDGPS